VRTVRMGRMERVGGCDVEGTVQRFSLRGVCSGPASQRGLWTKRETTRGTSRWDEQVGNTASWNPSQQTQTLALLPPRSLSTNGEPIRVEPRRGKSRRTTLRRTAPRRLTL
jgi:hypothetical protein